ncbi:unnamed protein product, partial [Didymodactylos carnosus]
GPMNNILRRWENLQTSSGLVELSYTLASFIGFGTYKIRCQAQNTIEERPFLVDFFLQKKIEVNVSLPLFIHVDSPTVSGIVTANYTTGRGVVGQMRLTVRLRKEDEHFEPAVHPIPPDQPGPKLDYFYEFFNGRIDFSIPMVEVVDQFGSLINRELIVTATVFDPLWNETTNSSFLTSLYTTVYKLKFLNRQSRVFRPRMSYIAYIAALNGDNSPFHLHNDTMKKSTFIRIYVNFDNSKSLAAVEYPINDDSIIKHEILVPPDEDAYYMSVRAELFINNTYVPNTLIEQRSVRYQSPSFSFIQISTSTFHPRIDDFMIFTVNISHYCERVYYHIVASSRIVHTDILRMNALQQSFDVAITRKMAPSAHIIAYFIHTTGELVADVLHFHVNITSFATHLNLTINQRKDLSGKTVELLSYSSPQSVIAFAGTEYAQHQLYGGNQLSEMAIYNELYTYDINAEPGPNITWYQDFLTPITTIFRVGHSSASNVYEVFKYTGLFLLSDIETVVAEAQDETYCKEHGGQLTCNDGTCYTISEKCDGKFQCQDGVDERDCTEKSEIAFTPINKRLWPYWERFFTLTFAWATQNNYPDGRAQLTVDVPSVRATWVVSALSISHKTGLSILPYSVIFEGTRQFFITVEIPPFVRLGEQIGARVDVFNYQPYRIEALIILHASPKYRFVNIDANGLVSSFQPRTSEGHHHVLLIIDPSDTRRVYIPFVPIVDGSVEVIIEGVTGANRDIITKQIEVSYEGIINYYHTSTLVLLENIPRQMMELDINVTENYIFPLENYFRYVPGSAKAEIFISGDVAGPFFWKGVDVTHTADNFVTKTVAPAESALLGFNMMLYNLIYMRQGHGGRAFDDEKLILFLNHANIEYQRLMAFYFDDGSDEGIYDGAFSNFGWKNETSVWMTSWVLIGLKDATQPEWEERNLFIDPKVRAKSAQWLASKQNLDGSWPELSNILDREKFQPRLFSTNGIPLNISLTAQSVIALKMNMDINGLLKDDIADSVERGRLWLEKHFRAITDVFELAITTYALHVVNSPDKDIAFNILIKKQRQNTNGMYWSNVDIRPNEIMYTALTERLSPKFESDIEAYAIAATSFVLLTYISRAETAKSSDLLKWIQHHRNFIGGWCSTYDTFFAQKAIVDYAIRRGDSIQQYQLRFNISSSDDSENMMEPILITDTNLINTQQRSIQNVYGRAFIDAYGTGYSLVQMVVQNNVEFPWLIRSEPANRFNLTLDIKMSGYNNSILLYQVCITWLPGLFKSHRSGWSIYTIDIPTGYRIEERYLKDLVGFGIVRNLRDAENYPNSLNFLFEFFDLTPICWEFELKRWIPVANMTRYYHMKVYEWHEPCESDE